jgi:3-methyladenine DNA glycosylase/8-oxoguanine DNA glycosylase
MHLRHEHTFTLTIPEPFDFALTVAKPAGWHWSTPKEIFRHGTLWTGLYVNGIPAGLVMTSEKDRVRVRAFTEQPLEGAERDDLADIVRAGLGADEDLAGFYAFAKGDPVLDRATSDHSGMRIGDLDDVFGGVVLAILLQMAPIGRSEQMMDAVLTLAGTKVTFDRHEVTLWPRPEEIIAAGAGVLREKAKLGYRAERLVKAAEYLRDNPLSLRQLAKLPEEEAQEALTAIPGIGKYSAAIIFGQSTPPIDAWSVVIMSELYNHRTPSNSRQEIERVTADVAARWGRWSWLAFAYILNDIGALAREYKLSRVQ